MKTKSLIISVVSTIITLFGISVANADTCLEQPDQVIQNLEKSLGIPNRYSYNFSLRGSTLLIDGSSKKAGDEKWFYIPSMRLYQQFWQKPSIRLGETSITEVKTITKKFTDYDQEYIRQVSSLLFVDKVETVLPRQADMDLDSTDYYLGTTRRGRDDFFWSLGKINRTTSWGPSIICDHPHDPIGPQRDSLGIFIRWVKKF